MMEQWMEAADRIIDSETVGDPAYPLMLLRRVITVSLEMMKIVKALPLLGDLS